MIFFLNLISRFGKYFGRSPHQFVIGNFQDNVISDFIYFFYPDINLCKNRILLQTKNWGPRESKICKCILSHFNGVNETVKNVTTSIVNHDSQAVNIRH
jgi:hypothetical protein